MNRQQLTLKPLSVAALAFAISSCATTATNDQQPAKTGRLAACPAAPHCVSSDMPDDQKTARYIKPLKISGLANVAWDAAVEEILSNDKASIADKSAGYLRAEIVSPWRFYTDDLELRLDVTQRFIHVRSSSRIGYYDFEVNRERVESLRSALIAKGLIKG
jgi:uncharacterized protein (DUF1499 family)